MYRLLLPVFQLFGPDKFRQRSRAAKTYDAWVVGYHRIGKKVCRALQEKGASFAVIDFDPEAIEELRRAKIPAFFGDIADVEFLSDLPIGNAELVVMTTPAIDDQMNFVAHIFSMNPDALIVANAYYQSEADALYDAGVH